MTERNTAAPPKRDRKKEHANRKFDMMKAMRFDPRVRSSSYEVMCALLEFTSHDQPCVPSMNRLAIDLGCDEKTVERGLKGHCFNVASLKHWDKTVPDGPIYFVRVRTGFKKPYRYVPVDDRVKAMLKELKAAVGKYKEQFQSTDEDSLTDSEIRGDNLGGSSTPNPVPPVPPDLSAKQVSINPVSLTSEVGLMRASVGLGRNERFDERRYPLTDTGSLQENSYRKISEGF